MASFVEDRAVKDENSFREPRPSRCSEVPGASSNRPCRYPEHKFILISVTDPDPDPDPEPPGST